MKYLVILGSILVVLIIIIYISFSRTSQAKRSVRFRRFTGGSAYSSLNTSLDSPLQQLRPGPAEEPPMARMTSTTAANAPEQQRKVQFDPFEPIETGYGNGSTPVPDADGRRSSDTAGTSQSEASLWHHPADSSERNTKGIQSIMNADPIVFGPKSAVPPPRVPSAPHDQVGPTAKSKRGVLLHEANNNSFGFALKNTYRAEQTRDIQTTTPWLVPSKNSNDPRDYMDRFVEMGTNTKQTTETPRSTANKGDKDPYADREAISRNVHIFGAHPSTAKLIEVTAAPVLPTSAGSTMPYYTASNAPKSTKIQRYNTSNTDVNARPVSVASSAQPASAALASASSTMILSKGSIKAHDVVMDVSTAGRDGMYDPAPQRSHGGNELNKHDIDSGSVRFSKDAGLSVPASSTAHLHTQTQSRNLSAKEDQQRIAQTTTLLPTHTGSSTASANPITIDQGQEMVVNSFETDRVRTSIESMPSSYELSGAASDPSHRGTHVVWSREVQNKEQDKLTMMKTRDLLSEYKSADSERGYAANQTVSEKIQSKKTHTSNQDNSRTAHLARQDMEIDLSNALTVTSAAATDNPTYRRTDSIWSKQTTSREQDTTLHGRDQLAAYASSTVDDINGHQPTSEKTHWLSGDEGGVDDGADQVHLTRQDMEIDLSNALTITSATANDNPTYRRALWSKQISNKEQDTTLHGRDQLAAYASSAAADSTDTQQPASEKTHWLSGGNPVGGADDGADQVYLARQDMDIDLAMQPQMQQDESSNKESHERFLQMDRERYTSGAYIDQRVDMDIDLSTSRQTANTTDADARHSNTDPSRLNHERTAQVYDRVEDLSALRVQEGDFKGRKVAVDQQPSATNEKMMKATSGAIVSKLKRGDASVGGAVATTSLKRPRMTKNVTFSSPIAFVKTV